MSEAKHTPAQETTPARCPSCGSRSTWERLCMIENCGKVIRKKSGGVRTRTPLGSSVPAAIVNKDLKIRRKLLYDGVPNACIKRERMNENETIARPWMNAIEKLAPVFRASCCFGRLIHPRLPGKVWIGSSTREDRGIPAPV